METPISHFSDLKLKLFAAVIGILIISGSGQVTAGQLDANECGSVLGLGVLTACQGFIEKEGPQVKPSNFCCDSVAVIGVPCVCNVITKVVENVISMEKLLFVAQSCGQPIQPGTTCGSYKVPPA